MRYRHIGQRHFDKANLDRRVERGIIGHWGPLGSNKNLIDLSGLGNQAVGNNITGTVRILGQGGHRVASKLDGINQNYDILNTYAGFYVSTLTISAWIYVYVAQTGYILAAWGSADGPRYGFAYAATGAVTAFYRNNTNDNNTQRGSGAGTVPLLTWVHVAGVIQGASTEIDMYVNGVLTNGTLTNNGAGIYTGGTNPVLCIGALRSGDAFGPLSAAVDDVRLYSRALSGAEIALLADPSFSPVLPTSLRSKNIVAAAATTGIGYYGPDGYY